MFWSQSSYTNASQVEERLQAHVDRKVEVVEDRLQLYMDKKVESLRSELSAVRSELLALLADSAGRSHDVDRLAVEVMNERRAEKGEEPPPVFASADHLDQHDQYRLGESIWDCAVLIGLDCIGPGETVVTALVLGLNIFVQLFFCWIIRYKGGLLEVPVSSDMLTELLHFRTSVAHDVRNANTASGRSLLSRVCEGEAQLHMSGMQVSLYEDLGFFGETGEVLCMLALLCWSVSALAELNCTVRFMQALFERKGKSTRIIVHGKGKLEMESLSSFDLVKVTLLSVLFRFATAILLFYVGALYLSRTSRLEDLLLNAVALAFVMEVDELFYAAFVPHRVKSLITSLVPLHLTPKMPMRGQWFQRYNKVVGGSPGAMLRLLVLAAVLTVMYFQELAPFHGRVKQAVDILCSGDRDFVYSIDPASGMVVAARSAKPDESISLAVAECAVLQLAHPKLQGKFGWSLPDCEGVDPERLDQSSVESAPVLLQLQWVYKLATGELPEFTPAEFDYVSSLARAGVEQAALNALCEDKVTAQHNSSVTYLAALREAVGGKANVSSCKDVKPMCFWGNMTRVRALCPMTCECNLWGFTAAGFYKTPHWGCPKQCEAESLILEQRLAADGLSPLECLDFTNTRYFFPPGLDLGLWQLFAVADIDQDGNLTKAEVTLSFLRHTLDEEIWSDLFFFDLDGDGVWDPSEQSSMNSVYEGIDALDSDHDGSLSVTETNAAIDSSAFKDVDGDGFITAAEMAGHPQGLDVVVLPPPARITVDGMQGASFWINGLMENLWSRPNFLESAERKVKLLSSYIGLTAEQELGIVTDLVLGVTFGNWIWGKWLLGPGTPHPRGLTWCAFLTSWETVLLLGVNVCEPGDGSSLRTMCPQSCSCEAHMKDCPSSCPNAHKMGSTWSQGA